MTRIGLFGTEYDECVNRLKVHIEDRGHSARVINFQHLPRVTRGTVDAERVVYDGCDLLGMDGFFLKEMDVRDPFFHVHYSEELWDMLRERYLDFAEGERENILYIRNLLRLLAERRPFVNHPAVYEHRNQIPYHLASLAHRGFCVPRFIAGHGGEAISTVCERTDEKAEHGDDSSDGVFDDIPLRMDEFRVWDVFSFRKGNAREVRIRRETGTGTIYKLIVIGTDPIDRAVALRPGAESGRVVPMNEVPGNAVETALRAAGAIGATFAAVEVQCGEDGSAVVVRQIDPAPEFFMLEDTYRLSISEPLADYLIAAGSQRA